MAQRSKKKVSKDPSFRTLKADYYPVQRTFGLTSSDAAGNVHLLDVGRALSVTNHRLYRQGKTYKVKLDLINATANTGRYQVWALVDTWYIQKAWQLAKATYDQTMVDERANMAKGQAARWEDFRVESGITAATVWPGFYDSALTGASALTAGEFDLSRITLPDGTTQRTFTWGATAGTELGILEEYDKSGNTDTASFTSSAPYAGVISESSEAAADDLKTRGDAPPYDATTFGNKIWVRVATLDNTQPAQAGTTRLSTGYFNAPCGLVVVASPTPNVGLTANVTCTVQAGDYKGVAAMNMGV